MNVSDINVNLAPNIKGKESEIELKFTTHNEDIRRIHRFQLILPDCYAGFDIRKLAIRSSHKVQGSFNKSECKAEFQFLDDIKKNASIYIVIERSNRILLPETNTFRPQFRAGTVLSTKSYEFENVLDLVDEDPMSDLSDDEMSGIREGVRVNRIEHMTSKITDLDVSDVKASHMKSNWISKEQHRHKDFKHAALDAAIVDAEIERKYRHRRLCRDISRMVKKHLLDLAKRKHFTIHSI